MIDYKKLTDEELKDLVRGKTKLFLSRAEGNDRLYDDLLRGIAIEDILKNELASINMEIYRRRGE